jgi:hypothetical protein
MQPLPIEYLNSHTADHEPGEPDIWKRLERVHLDPQDELLSPRELAAACRIVPGEMCNLVAALAAWRKNKIVYRFDRGLLDVLSESDGSLDMPLSLLDFLPVETFYVELSPSSGYWAQMINVADEHGGTEIRAVNIFYTWLMDDGGISGEWLQATSQGPFDRGDGIPTNPKPEERTFRSIRDLFATHKEIAPDTPFSELDDSVVNDVVASLLYLCAENRELARDSRLRRNKTPKEFSKIKDVQRELIVWEAAPTITERIRKFGASAIYGHSPASGHGTGARKSPHVRRAHWHTYWTGPRNSDERKQIVRWVLPTFVNADLLEEGAESPIMFVNEVEL